MLWVQSAVQQADGLLLLLTVACMPSRPMFAYVAFACAGQINPSLMFRGHIGDGILFAVCMGPVLAVVYRQNGGGGPGSAVSPDLVALGSLQALIDLAVAMRPAQQVAQVVAFAAAGVAFAGSPLATVSIFLITEKSIVSWCFGTRRWGRCFSPAEGLCWAQAIAVFCATFHEGYVSSFFGWSNEGLFSSFLVLFGFSFLVISAVVQVLVIETHGSSTALLPLGAALVTLPLAFMWAATGFGGWALRCRDTPFMWFMKLLGTNGHWKLLLLQWPVLLVVGIGLIDSLARRSTVLCNDCKGDAAAKHEQVRVRVLYRKAFHALAVALFLPPLLCRQAAFLGVSLLVAALLFVVLEVCRICRVPGLAHGLDLFVGRYLDKREDTSRGDLVLTHLYLLLGCAIPVWLESEHKRSQHEQMSMNAALVALQQASGILLVGVGDACAAACGVSFGTIRWPLSHRTVEGSLAYIVSVFVASAFILLVVLSREGKESTSRGLWAEVMAFLSATLLSSLLEVYTQSIDNIMLPLYFCPTLRVFSGALR